MQKVQKTYTPELKREAVRLAQSSGNPMLRRARELGISDTSIPEWRKELTEHGSEAFPGSGHQTAQEEEIRLYWLLGSSVRENHCKSERAYLLWLQKTYSSGTM